jgi:hypothetical protein
MSEEQPQPEQSAEIVIQSPAEVKAVATRAQSVALGRRGIELENLQDLMNFARTAVKNNVAPKGMNEGQAALAIQAGLERGMGLMGGLQACVVVNGVLSWRGWAAIGFIQNCGLVVPGTLKTYCEGAIEEGTLRGVCVAQRKGYAQAFVRTFSVQDAKVAGLWGKGGPWQTRPTNMLEWRAVGDMARFHFPEALGGVPIAEDVLAGGVGPQDGPSVEPRASSEPLRGQRFVGPGPAISDPILGELGVSESEVVEATLVETKKPEEGGAGEQPGTPEAPSAPPPTKPPDPSILGADGFPDASKMIAKAKKAEAARPEKCPRCGGEEFDVFGTCPACNWPGAEPGA